MPGAQTSKSYYGLGYLDNARSNYIASSAAFTIIPFVSCVRPYLYCVRYICHVRYAALYCKRVQCAWNILWYCQRDACKIQIRCCSLVTRIHENRRESICVGYIFGTFRHFTVINYDNCANCFPHSLIYDKKEKKSRCWLELYITASILSGIGSNLLNTLRSAAIK